MSDPRTPEDEAKGLLEQIADTALDDDYYVVRTEPYGQSREFNTVLTGAVLGLFALLVAIAAIQTQSDRPTSERERETLINNVDARKTSLAKREITAERLRERVAELKASVDVIDPAFEKLRVLTADSGAKGPGIRLDINEGRILPNVIADRDLQRLVNGLWYAGAEAVAVNGKRIGSLSSIRMAAGIMKVNYDPVGPPYEIIALGDAESLEERFSQTVVGREWEARSKRDEVSFDMAGSDELMVEAAPKERLTILHAKAIEGDE